MSHAVSHRARSLRPHRLRRPPRRWENRRASIVEASPFPGRDRLPFHVRDLDRMRRALLLVQNLAARPDVPAEVAEHTDLLRIELDETLEELRGTE